MLISNPKEYLDTMMKVADKLGSDSVQYLGDQEYLVVSAKPYGAPYSIRANFEAGKGVEFSISREGAIDRLSGVKA